VHFAFGFELSKLVFVEHFAVVKQSSYERAFAVVYAPARYESKQFFAFMLLEISQNIRGYQFALMRHA
jgi:hypothetical protein